MGDRPSVAMRIESIVQIAPAANGAELREPKLAARRYGQLLDKPKKPTAQAGSGSIANDTTPGTGEGFT